MILPVTILHISGEDNYANQQQAQQGGGWGSYLHRWSGLV
jgi:hypothetical protein